MRSVVELALPSVRWPIDSDDESFSDILRTEHAGWFLEILRRIDGLTIDPELCQEDWGVVAFAKQGKLAFWIGLRWYDKDDQGFKNPASSPSDP